jgi:hypothetical protein
MDHQRKQYAAAKKESDDHLLNHKQFINVAAGQVTIFRALLFAQLFVYLLDYLVSSAVSEYISRMANMSGYAVMLTKKAIPAIIIAIEITIDCARSYYNYINEGDKHRLSRILFFCMAIFLSIGMPSLFVGTQLAARHSESNPLPLLIFLLIVIPLSILTFASHILMVLGEMAAFEARSYFAFLITRARLDRKVRRADTALRRTEQRLLDVFQLCYQQIQQHKNRFGEGLKIAFIELAVQIINDLFGYEIIPTPKKSDDRCPDDGGGGDDFPPDTASAEASLTDDPESETKEASTDDDPIFAPSRAEWDPFKK